MRLPPGGIPLVPLRAPKRHPVDLVSRIPPIGVEKVFAIHHIQSRRPRGRLYLLTLRRVVDRSRGLRIRGQPRVGISRDGDELVFGGHAERSTLNGAATTA